MATREHVLANTLHILSSSTTTSPLSFSEGDGICISPPPARGSEPDQVQEIGVGLKQLLSQLRHDDSAVDEIMCIMTDFSGGDPDFGDDSYSDRIIWISGLKLIDRIIRDDEVNNICSERIEPHIILSTLMDFYYHGDESVQMHEVDDIQSDGNMSTQIAMFYLGSILAAYAIEKAVNITRQSIKASSTIRWRRLRSMIDDLVALFKRMVSTQVELARESSTNQLTQRVISVAIYVYTRHVLPDCRNLLQLLLQHSPLASSDSSFTTRIARTSYDCFGVLTSLAALHFIFGEGDTISSGVVSIMKCLHDPNNDSLFTLMMSRNIADANADQIQICKRFCLWNNIALNKCDRGLHFIEDLLLYPAIRVAYEFHITRLIDENEDETNYDDDSDECSDDAPDTFDSLGLALVAYCLEQVPLKAEMTLPYAYSREYLWILLFPHVHVFLNGFKSSATFNLMNEDVLNETKAIESGLELLEKMMQCAPTIIQPYSRLLSQNKEGTFIVCSTTLESTIESLLSTVLRLSMFEAASHNTANSSPLKYTSRQVMIMTQSLLGLYERNVRISALASLSHKIKGNHQLQVLLPRVLDWMRPVIMSMSAGIRDNNLVEKKYISDDDISIMQAVTDTLTPFMRDLEIVFDQTKPPLPRDIAEFMSMVETYTSTLSVFRSIRMWVHHVQQISAKANEECHVEHDQFHEIKKWVAQNETMLKNFSDLLADLLDFWSRACSPRDVKVCVGDNIDPPLQWHRLFLLLHSLQGSLEQLGG